MRFRRNQPSPKAPQGPKMTINKVRSTDDPTGRPMPFIMRTAEDARNAPPPTYHCGWCSFSSPDTDHRAIRDRSCLSPTGKDLTEAKRIHAEGARRLSESLKLPPVTCMFCNLVSEAGASHDCPGHSAQVMPHDIQRPGGSARAPSSSSPQNSKNSKGFRNDPPSLQSPPHREAERRDGASSRGRPLRLKHSSPVSSR